MDTRAESLTQNGVNPGGILKTLLEQFGLDSLPAHPMQEPKGKITVSLNMLHCDPLQLDEIKAVYAKEQHFHRLFIESAASQIDAKECLGEQNLFLEEIGDLGNGWSRRWSKTLDSNAAGPKGALLKQRILFQCQSGTSTKARETKAYNKKIQQTVFAGSELSEGWKRKIPYEFTGCLAHLDLTYSPQTLIIYRITGILEHDDSCKNKLMSRLPGIPLHPHVWQEALLQINNGANITAVQKRNQELYQARLYHGQAETDPKKNNYRYIFLQCDSRTLYRKQAYSLGVDLQKQPHDNIDDWLSPSSMMYKPELSSAVFFYRGRSQLHERLILCIQTEEMKSAAWEYSHEKQLVLDGTFGICDRRVLLFIALGVDTRNRGIPLAFFLFSAPTGNQATHSGYDTSILTELLGLWVKAMGTTPDGRSFAPKVAITDTDTKERGALLAVWPNITLLLCKFHTRQCWTNKRKTLIKPSSVATAEISNKERINKRLQILESALIVSDNYNDAVNLIETEKQWLTILASTALHDHSVINGGLTYLNYLFNYWLTESMWQSWSTFGRKAASQLLSIPLDEVIPTTNHLEAFNGVLKHKYIHRYQKTGRRIRLDLLVKLLVSHILPSVFAQHTMERDYHDWLAIRFGEKLRNKEIISFKKTSPSLKQEGPTRPFIITWWSSELQACHFEPAQYIIKHKRIYDFKWDGPHTVIATCASSLANVDGKNETCYELALNSYGLAMCGCPFNSKGNGACKHLWAFRYILPTLSPEVYFYFPLSQEAAEQIYLVFFPSGHVAPNSTDATSMIDLPTLPKNSLLPHATMVNTLASITSSVESDNSDTDGEDGPFDSDTENDFTITAPILASRAALDEQFRAHIDQQMIALIPGLHKLLRALKDGQPTTFGEIPTYPEFKRTLDMVNDTLSATNNHPERTMIQPDDGAGPNTGLLGQPPPDATQNTMRKHFVPVPSGTQRRRLLPASPERAQKRKHSTATY